MFSFGSADYKEYASSHYSGLWTAPALALMSSAMVRAYCHKVIKLSDALQSYAPEKEETSNVHGVRGDFLREGQRRAEATKNVTEVDDGTLAGPATTQSYFIGKLLWTKGLDILLELEDYYKQYTGNYFAIDIYGNGPDQKDIMRAYLGRRNPDLESDVITTTLSLEGGTAAEEAVQSISSLRKARDKLAKIKNTINSVEIPKSFHELRRQPIPSTFPGRVDHATLTAQYKVFINPSVSEGTFFGRMNACIILPRRF
jgi:hypothetical protein